MRTYRYVLLLVAIVGGLSACNLSSLLEPIDYPPSPSYLKGPRADTLNTRSFALTQTHSFQYPGQVSQYGSRYLLRGYNGNGNRLSVITAGTMLDVAHTEPEAFSEFFLDEGGGLWGLTRQQQQNTIRQYQSGQWMEYATLSGIGNFYSVIKAEPNEFRFYTSTGLVVWDVQQKVVKQTIPNERARFLTKNYSIGSNGQTLTLYDSDATRQLASWPLDQYVSVKKGISNDIWAASEDKNGHLWLVIKNSNWDGVLLKYDSQSLRKLSMIPVGYYDSGRSVNGLTLDKAGNLWVEVDHTNYLYTTSGKWVRPLFDSVDKDRWTPIFSDDRSELTLATEKGLYRINQ
ncbi:hypothetical protein [Spirosoma sp.]|uniref:hypothetical protein n=1 Tax=Spirosoma sp. TaxID=1899569 RepID=UPI003B3A4DD6